MKPNGKPGSFYLARAVAITLDLLIFILGESGFSIDKSHVVHANNFNNCVIFFSPSSAVVTLVFIEFYAENTKRGFFCRDPSISYKEQKDTISIKTIIVYGLTPIIVVSWIEFLTVLCRKKIRRQNET